jgi:hypothetical protein
MPAIIFGTIAAEIDLRQVISHIVTSQLSGDRLDGGLKDVCCDTSFKPPEKQQTMCVKTYETSHGRDS